MHRHRNFAVSIVLLLTMAVSIVETAAAAFCPPMEQMSADEMHGMAVDHGGAADADHRGAPEPTPNDDCPLAPAGVTQGCTLASLPASGLAALASPADAMVELSGTRITPDLLLVSVLFHPPRA